MPEKRKVKKVRDLKAKSLGNQARKIKGGAQPPGGPRTLEPVNTRPKPVEPINS